MERLRKPEWLKVKKGGLRCGRVGRVLEKYAVNTVCEQAGCPNIGECFQSGTATFLLLGNHCTRNCTFCKVTQDAPQPVNPKEPNHIAEAAKELSLRHVVITSVTRDDLPDGGAGHFAATVNAVRLLSPQTVIEVLIPDFQGNEDALETVIRANPDILNHNVETVPALYEKIRPKALFTRSLTLLRRAKAIRPTMLIKSGFMLGLGENRTQILSLLQELQEAGCDIVTIGQYLAPSPAHYPVQEYVHPSQFDEYQRLALDMGIPCVASGPLVRSSYHAESQYKSSAFLLPDSK